MSVWVLSGGSAVRVVMGGEVVISLLSILGN